MREIERVIERLRVWVGDRDQVECARELHIGPSTLSRLLAGKSQPSLKTFARLATRFGPGNASEETSMLMAASEGDGSELGSIRSMFQALLDQNRRVTKVLEELTATRKNLETKMDQILKILADRRR